MFFVLSKILSFFIAPFNWLLIWLLIFLFIKNQQWKKRFKWIAIAWFIFFSNPYIIHRLSLTWQAPARELSAGEKFNTAIVLGGFVKFDAKENKGYFSDASDRFLQAVRLYKLGHVSNILISGGSGKVFHQQYKDADFAREQLIQFGIDPAHILIENNSRNSFENAINSKKILDSFSIPGPYLLVTSAMHIPRAEKVFTKAGLQVISYPAHFTAMNFPMGFATAVIPSINAFNNWEQLLKEVVGLQVYKLTGKA